MASGMAGSIEDVERPISEVVKRSKIPNNGDTRDGFREVQLPNLAIREAVRSCLSSIGFHGPTRHIFRFESRSYNEARGRRKRGRVACVIPVVMRPNDRIDGL